MGWFNWGNKSKSRSTLAPSRKGKPDTTWSDKHLEREIRRLQTLVDMGYQKNEFKEDLIKVKAIKTTKEDAEAEETARQAEKDYEMNNPGPMVDTGGLQRKKKKKKTKRKKTKRKKPRTKKKRTKKKRTKRNNLTKRR